MEENHKLTIVCRCWPPLATKYFPEPPAYPSRLSSGGETEAQERREHTWTTRVNQHNPFSRTLSCRVACQCDASRACVLVEIVQRHATKLVNMGVNIRDYQSTTHMILPHSAPGSPSNPQLFHTTSPTCRFSLEGKGMVFQPS